MRGSSLFDDDDALGLSAALLIDALKLLFAQLFDAFLNLALLPAEVCELVHAVPVGLTMHCEILLKDLV